jgi:hypothetical protein
MMSGVNPDIQVRQAQNQRNKKCSYHAKNFKKKCLKNNYNLQLRQIRVL